LKFTQLRLAGFKSFVEPAELSIGPGLTGVIGPNGCGKSNLLEAMRWVMGATSAKSLRGGGMEDVIFSGTDTRAARDRAEVMLRIDNSDRRAPARFNDAEILEVVRRITRGKGSDYRINGEEVRAKDVQLLFADAGTGANSPALVRQGQISELINARPENRRLILEEAAGVAGLRARRREAQLRLNAAEANLDRLLEIVEELDSRCQSLQRQARQAGRYRDLSKKIRNIEALLWLRRWSEAGESVKAAASALEEEDARAETAIRAAAAATANAEQAASAVAPLRQSEAERAAALRYAENARDQLDRDLEAAREMIARLGARLAELQAGEAREHELHEEARQSLERLRRQLGAVHEQAAGDAPAQARAQAALKDAEGLRARAEAELDEAAARCAAIREHRQGARRAAGQAAERASKLENEAETARAALAQFEAGTGPDIAGLEARALDAAQDLEAAREALENAEKTLEAARETAAAARDGAREAEGEAAALEREAESLERFLAAGDNEDQALDHVAAETGYEQALAAALGEDLEAGLSPGAARRWTVTGADADALPEGAEPLSRHVSAPDALRRRLSATGVAGDGDLERLAAQLRPGQRLVTRAGALRRWDGYAAEAGAPSPAAIRLETRNRLAELSGQIETARAKARDLGADAQLRLDALHQAEETARNARKRLRELEAARDEAGRALSQARAEAARAEARRTGLAEACEAASNRLEAARADLADAETALREAEAADDGASALDAARIRAERARGAAADARAALESVRREAQERRHRIDSLERESEDWRRRETSARERLEGLRGEIKDTASKLEEARTRPDELETGRSAILDALTAAETEAAQARERVAQAEIAQREADAALRAAEKDAAGARESRAAAAARLAGAEERLQETAERLRDATGETPQALTVRAGDNEYASLSSAELERRLDEARLTRERLGAVNLRADEEARELDAERTRLARERDDLVEAVARLRKAVDTLSREGRARLLDAFDVVDGHFRTLFSTLFDGGHAELRLTENEDPLEAGLEIFACPPGKKMETMSLLSGGEQALTATALIFAVFLVNPSPVCVLDEVDAPLDDANVDRFCTMLEQMRTMTETRFLVITHNAVTMSRMDRLFGVTMGERGVSQLVSVNLRGAEAVLAAE